MASMDNKPKTKRRRFRFSLRTLLLLVTVASLGFGWLGYKLRQAERQRAAVELLRELDAEVERMRAFLGLSATSSPR